MDLNNKYDVVYVCSPLRADNPDEQKENMTLAKTYCQMFSAVLDCRAIAPHSFLPDILHDDIPKERADALEICLKLVEICDAVFVIGNKITEGMQLEIDYAVSKNIPVVQCDVEAYTSKLRGGGNN